MLSLKEGMYNKYYNKIDVNTKYVYRIYKNSRYVNIASNDYGHSINKTREHCNRSKR